jgi:hypothetical protein
VALVADSWSAWLPLGLLFSSPWIAAIAWIYLRTRGQAPDREAVPPLADLWRRRV